MPDGLQFQDLEEEPEKVGITREGFCNWLQEGRYDCTTAIAVLHSWLYGPNSAHGNSSSKDFFDSLLEFLHNPDYNRDADFKALAKQH